VEIVGVSRFAPCLPLLLMVPLGNQSSAEALRVASLRLRPSCRFFCGDLNQPSLHTPYSELSHSSYLASYTTHPVPHKLTLMPSFADISKGFSLRYEGSLVSENK